MPIPTPSTQGQNPFDLSSLLMGSAADVYGDMANSGSLGNINQYVDPYYQEVLDTVLGRMQTNQNTFVNSIGDAAQKSKAFGGSRHGVMEGVAQGEYNRNVGDVTAQMSSQAFTDAAERAYRDQTTAAGGMTQLGSQYYNVGTDLTDRQSGVGGQQQDLLQQILTGGSDQFSDYMANPYRMIDMLSAILGGDARRGNAQGISSSTPGLFDYVSLLFQASGE